MHVGNYDIITLYLVTIVCLTKDILATKVFRDFQPVTSLQSPPLSYLPTANTVFPKLSQHVFPEQALDNGLKDVGGSGIGFAGRPIEAGYSYPKPLPPNFKLPAIDSKIKSIIDKQRSGKELQRNHEVTAIKTVQSSRAGAPGLRTQVEYQPHIPRRSSYQVVEELGEYLMDDSDHAELPYRGKVQTNSHRNSQDITTAIKALDHFLSGVLNDGSYNSALHPPPNPVLALVLSQYGRYVPRARNSRVYANMAVNNIHNHKPFGSYKIEYEEPAYVRR